MSDNLSLLQLVWGVLGPEMPTDEWLKAKMRAQYGPVRYAKKKKQRRRKRPVRERPSEEVRDAAKCLGPDSVMWFGKHKGTLLRDVPDSYFRWLTAQPESGIQASGPARTRILGLRFWAKRHRL